MFKNKVKSNLLVRSARDRFVRVHGPIALGLVDYLDLDHAVGFGHNLAVDFVQKMSHVKMMSHCHHLIDVIHQNQTTATVFEIVDFVQQLKSKY